MEFGFPHQASAHGDQEDIYASHDQEVFDPILNRTIKWPTSFVPVRLCCS